MANSPARFQVRFEVDGDGNVKAAMDSIATKARDVSSAADDVSKRWYEASISLGSALKVGSVALGGLGGAFALVIKNSVEAENSLAQLNAVLKSSGQDANFSAEQITGMADSIAKASNFSGSEVTDAATRLLSYSGIAKEQFAPALQVAIDQAARLGISVTQSAEIVGRALESPTKAAAALAQQGFGAAFTDSVRESIKALEDAGREAEAQKIIIDILNESYGGASVAARDTLGGALKELKDTLGNLLEGDAEGEGLKGLRQTIEDLIKTMNDPEVKEGFRVIIEGALKAANAFAQWGSQIGPATAFLGEEIAARVHGPAGDDTVRIDDEIKRLQDQQAYRKNGMTSDSMMTNMGLTRASWKSDAEIAKRIAELQQLRETFANIEPPKANDPIPSPPPIRWRPPPGTTTTTDTSTRKAALSEEDRAAQQLDRTYQRLMDRYAEEIALGRNASEEAKVRYMIEHEGLQGLDAARQKALITQAQYTDQMEVEEALQRSLQELDDQRSWVLDDLEAERAALGLSNDELEIRANLLRAEVSRESDWGKTIAENTRQLQQERRATNDQIDAMDSVRDAGKDLFMGAATSADSFGDVAINALERLRNRMLEMAAERLMDQIFGVYGTTQTGSAGGWMASLGGWVGSLFGGGRATGGAIRAGSIYEVSEGGAPELLRQNGRTYLLPGADGTVIPARYAAGGGAAGGAAGALQVQVNNYGKNKVATREEFSNGPDGNSLRKLVIDIIADDQASGGKTVRSLKSRFPGLKETVG